ncbi:hypothetical protein AGABI1DRAFT_115309 [Agaricus bisporus var. burnettii JB137-S8]|uniref:Uncharacterized protein n=1 Tax=Agaricus bisporus var. burnettii (strain JB137-S8 / ATCC MYA-4627 / FGSC 10392) TaxID=597362 RepID=K5X391_AGABU|nr:hypothetical protein AGABI2DRAFT_194271 [Agaricus bisporus var. bisporus H97]XP_007332039.1 uncharacterized protein AGABI1DRAFT_115309 [Agaricus bisporus var. burnettii JB137-S8]EKM77402.1 hypothetical protein AGABI1DRAFT_115309 [Agaricus bisporus var. burnettii JB137-S8]EKV45306.1 hypothetical protein AGABI2DRAFT_194271 [Agaricus bisporus var. bisporus H97]
MSRQQPETGYRSGGGYQTGDGGGGYGNPPYRASSTGYNPAPDYGPSSGYEVPSGGYPNNPRGGRKEPQYEKAGYQKPNERVETGRRGDDDYFQGTPGRYPDTPRTGAYDESGGGSSSGYRSRPYEGEGGGYRY